MTTSFSILIFPFLSFPLAFLSFFSFFSRWSHGNGQVGVGGMGNSEGERSWGCFWDGELELGGGVPT